MLKSDNWLISHEQTAIFISLFWFGCSVWIYLWLTINRIFIVYFLFYTFRKKGILEESTKHYTKHKLDMLCQTFSYCYSTVRFLYNLFYTDFILVLLSCKLIEHSWICSWNLQPMLNFLFKETTACLWLGLNHGGKY